MRYLLAALLSVCAIIAQAQQINPVPDYVFGNRMSVGRTSVTDTAAYFSVGPRYGAIRGMMPPMVVDTASVSGNKRNGLLIFSVQKNKFLYWDSVRVQWSDMAGSSGSYIVAGDTASMLLPYLRKADTTAMLAPYLKESDTVFLSNRVNLKVNISDTSSMLTNYVRHAGYGLTKSGQAFLVDTAAMATRARVQKGIDSVAAIAGSGFTGSGTTNYVAKFTGTKALGNSQIFDNGTRVGIGIASPGFKVHAVGTSEGYLVSEATNKGGGAGIITFSRNSDSTRQAGAVYFVPSTTTPYIGISGDGSQIHLAATSAGNIGIGNVAPAYKLDVTGTLRNTTGAAFATSSGNVLIGTTTDAGYKTDIAGTLRSTLGANFATTSGNVGIGTAAPLNKFSVFTGGDETANFTDLSGYASLVYRHRTTNAYRDGLIDAANLYINTESAGEVRIGSKTDAGDYKLQINGNERIAGKLDVITTTEYGVNLGRSGTSATAFQAYNSTAAMAVGIESSAGGGLFTGTSAYAAVFGNANDYPAQFITNNAVRATISAAGELLVGTTSDQGDYNIQTNNAIYAAGNAAGVGLLVGSDKSIETTGVNLNINANQGGAGLSTISMKLTSATPAFTFSSDAVLMFGTNTYSTMTNGLTMKNGTAPTGSATDQFHMYSADITAGNAAPHFRTENNAVIKLYQETTGVAAAAFTANSGTTVNDASTFDGYTLKQVVKALRNLGILQ